jgi:beta-xylosidase
VNAQLIAHRSFLIAFLIVLCTSYGQCREQQDAFYHNPVVSLNLPDPTLIKAADGYFYLYATGNLTPILRSKDLINWEQTGSAFTKETRPSWEPKGGIWAPDINYIDGQYVLYYAMSVWGGEWTCGIGRAVADKPEGPFTDLGMLFRSNTMDVQNSIDAFYIEDGGKNCLFWGSFSGIYGIELTGDGLNLKEGSVKKQVAGTAYEGAYIHKRSKYYYLFASTGTCCEGLNSTYKTVVGRSENLWGPYMDKSGRPMMENHHEIVIKGNDSFVGVGHNSEIVQDKAGNDWIFYHGFDVNHPEGRRLFLDKISWVNDWPTVAGDSPSTTADIPVF